MARTKTHTAPVPLFDYVIVFDNGEANAHIEAASLEEAIVKAMEKYSDYSWTITEVGNSRECGHRHTASMNVYTITFADRPLLNVIINETSFDRAYEFAVKRYPDFSWTLSE